MRATAHQDAHQKRDGNGHADGKRRPGTAFEDLDDGKAHGRNRDGHGEEDGDGGRHPDQRPELIAG
jgi:hypothetical protein